MFKLTVVLKDAERCKKEFQEPTCFKASVVEWLSGFSVSTISKLSRHLVSVPETYMKKKNTRFMY